MSVQLAAESQQSAKITGIKTVGIIMATGKPQHLLRLFALPGALRSGSAAGVP
jgi:hypothetical protein